MMLRKKLHEHGIEYTTPLQGAADERADEQPEATVAHGLSALDHSTDEGPHVPLGLGGMRGGGSMVYGGVSSLLLVQGHGHVHRLYNLLLELPHQDDVPCLLSPQVVRACACGRLCSANNAESACGWKRTARSPLSTCSMQVACVLHRGSLRITGYMSKHRPARC
jgi:hypothetical protein